MPFDFSAKLTRLGRSGSGFEVAVHMGSHIAVVSYFRHELMKMSNGWVVSQHKEMVGESRLARVALLGTIPAGLAGYFLKDMIELYSRSPMVIAKTLGMFFDSDDDNLHQIISPTCS